MRGLFLRFFVSFLALGFTAEILRGIEIRGVTSFDRALALGAAAMVLGVLNAVVRPILVFLTLPITIFTLGLFLLVLNGLLFWLTGSIVKGFYVADFGAAFFGTIIMSVISFVLNRVVRDSNEKKAKNPEWK